MPFNGSGVYKPVSSPDFPAVAGSIIRSTQYNNQINDMAAALTKCVTRDGQSSATADLPMGGHKHTNVAAAALRTQYARAAEVQDGTLTYLTNVVGANAITAVAPLALAAYSTGQTFRFRAAGVNTGATTLNINGLGATAITRQGATALVAGDIPAGSIVQVTYDGAQFQLQTPVFLPKVTSYMSAVVGGTADAITATFSPAIAALPTAPDTISVIVRAGAANATTTPTFAPGGLTAKTIVKGNNLALAAGDIAGAGHWLEMNFDTVLDKWVLQNPATGVAPALPTGSVIYVAQNSAPTGYLKANGAAVSRSTYSRLFAAIGTTFGGGDGSTTFTLPDLRGEFVRGWDDSRGVDSGRAMGSWQGGEIQSHTHNMTLSAYSYNMMTSNHGWGGDDIAHGPYTNTTSATGGAETRPRNIALLACIKF